MRAIKRKKGFTLVELSLSLVFIAVLSLTVAYIINDTIASYRKGVTLKQINTVGTGVVDDMRAAIQNSSAKSVKDDCSIVYGDIYKDGGKEWGARCEENGARNFVTVTAKADVVGRNGTDTLTGVPVFGAFCTGDYSYIWNSGYFFNEEDGAYKRDISGAATLTYKTSSGTETVDNFRLLKIKDELRAVCIVATGDQYGDSISQSFDITNVSDVINEEPIDLLASDEKSGGLALYDLYVSTPAESTTKNNLFYAVSFVLGTVQGGINIKTTGTCATPDDWQVENFDYCAINKFNFAAQATGG